VLVRAAGTADAFREVPTNEGEVLLGRHW
jgi:hypothetical protein